jgi:hypothetical protein
VLGVRRWRELVTDREKWKDIVRQAKAHHRLYSEWKKKTYGTNRHCEIPELSMGLMFTY